MSPEEIRAKLTRSLNIRDLVTRQASSIQAFALGLVISYLKINPPRGGWTMAAMQCESWEDCMELQRQIMIQTSQTA